MKRFAISFPAVLPLLLLTFCSGVFAAENPDAPDYENHIQPLLGKYCSGCHSEADREAGFSSESYASLNQGLKEKPVILPGDPDGSLLIRLIEGSAEPAMPPEGEDRPTEDEIALLRKWIETGAAGPAGKAPDRLMLSVPEIPAYQDARPITALATSDSGLMAVARYGEISLHTLPESTATETETLALDAPRWMAKELPGKVNSLHFSADGNRLAVASGVAGRGGWIGIYNTSTGKLEHEFRGHFDLAYDAEISPDGQTLATCSYDQSIILWNIKSGEQLRTLSGHNGAVYDLAYSPDGKFLLTACADDTCKVWRVSDGERLDTLGQPLKEAYACGFSPDGNRMAAVGADKKLRIWKLVSRDKPQINPQLYARFAHEAVVTHLAWLQDGKGLVTVSEAGVCKLWDARSMSEVHAWNETTKAVIAALALTPDSKAMLTARLDGTITRYPLPVWSSPTEEESSDQSENFLSQDVAALQTVAEAEPNQLPEAAQMLPGPVHITGVIHSAENAEPDFDLFRFQAEQGQPWVIEVNASRSQSPLDSFVEVLDSQGEKVLRTTLQAVRESYFTFRGKNSDQTNDFRIFNWTEMKLNEYLYANGEVAKFYHYPRGADSGFNVYPATGKRFGYFDTTPLSHALGEPCYVVRPVPPSEEVVPNGLPAFPIYYQNDDASQRDLGSDSRLFFTAPKAGEYLIRIHDVRGYEGADHKYTLTLRPQVPDFQPKINTRTLTLHHGSRQEFRVGTTRIDQYPGPIEFTFENVPEGIELTSPLTIEAGQYEAMGVISVAAGTEIKPELAKQITVTAKALVQGNEVSKSVQGFSEFKAGGEPKLTMRIVPAPGGAEPISQPGEGLLEFEISPGETIELKVIAERKGFNGPIGFGKEDSGRNMPFGVFVDNIGLNGLLITDENTERNFFVTCDPAAKPQSRLFHIRTNSAGGQASQSVMLHVRDE